MFQTWPTLKHWLSWDKSTRFYKKIFGAFKTIKKMLEKKYGAFCFKLASARLLTGYSTVEDTGQRDIQVFPVISSFETTLLTSCWIAHLSPSQGPLGHCLWIQAVLCSALSPISNSKIQREEFQFSFDWDLHFHSLLHWPFCLPDT